MSESRRALILMAVSDLASRFLYYDRKEDESLPVSAIDNAVAKNEITIDDIVAEFRKTLEENLP